MDHAIYKLYISIYFVCSLKLDLNVCTAKNDMIAFILSMIAECSICLKDITQNLITTTCGHKYHLPCLKTWVSQRETCPMCRAHVPAEIESDVPQSDHPAGRILIWHESVRSLPRYGKQLMARKRKLWLLQNQVVSNRKIGSTTIKLNKNSKTKNYFAIFIKPPPGIEPEAND